MINIDKLNKNNQLLDEANIIFKSEAASNYPKFKYLANWVNAESKYFRNERLKENKLNKVYQRGTLVMIDFGVNIGNKLSGNHFGIVLNKKDSPKNGVLTVVPVSSKGNAFSIKLDGLISKKSIEFINRYMAELDKKFSFWKSLQCYANTLSDAEYNGLQSRSYQYANLPNFTHNLISDFEEIKEIIKTYKRFNKVSFAKCLDIRTISKNRIKILNKFDPCGKIKVSSETLNKIDQKMIENFTS